MINAGLERCFSFINSHAVAPGQTVAGPRARRAVTISRQTGCGAVAIAEKLAHYLQPHAVPGVTWTVFDRQLMEKVLADHDLPKYLAEFLPEDRVSVLEDTMAELFGVHPPTKTVIQQTAETMIQLAGLGGAILVGRAANIVTAKMSNVLHVRLVAPLEDRIERICRTDHKTLEEARRFCIEEEQARARYVKTYYHVDISDPLLYHLVINTSTVGYDNVVQIIGDGVLRLGR